MNGFRVGDRVESPCGSRGRVASIDAAGVHIEFSEGARTWGGTCNELWFKRYPDMLKKLGGETR